MVGGAATLPAMDEGSRRRPRYKRPPRPGDPRVLKPEVVVASAAFLLSLTSAATSSWFVWRGPVVTASDPSRVFLYRDGDSLTLGVEAALVNSASPNFGDVVKEVGLYVGGSDAAPRFRQEVFLTPVFSEQVGEKHENCPISSRCVINGNFLAIEEPSRVLNVAGSTGSSVYVGFNLQDIYCSDSALCIRYNGLEGALNQLAANRRLNLHFRYYLASDGEKIAICQVDFPEGSTRGVSWLQERIMQSGWVVLPCTKRGTSK